MAKGDRSSKDKAMAARMKEEGERRTCCRCPMCHAVVSLVQLYNHVVLVRCVNAK